MNSLSLSVDMQINQLFLSSQAFPVAKKSLLSGEWVDVLQERKYFKIHTAIKNLSLNFCIH